MASSSENSFREDIRHVFCYGSLRPDDDSGQPWTDSAVKGLSGQRAIVEGATLYHDNYASMVLTPNYGVVHGWVLTSDDSNLFREKVALFDRIEGIDRGYYQKTVVTARLLDSSEGFIGKAIGPKDQLVRVFGYHRPNLNRDMATRIESGDWLKRVQ